MSDSKPLQMIVLACSGLTLLSALALGGLAGAEQKWATLGFEVVVLVASVFGVRWGLGRVREGKRLALACVALCFAAASVMGALGAQRELAGFSLDLLVLGRVGLAGVLIGVTAMMTYARGPAARSALIKSIAAGTPLAVLGGLAVLPQGQRLAVRFGDVEPLIQTGVVIFGFLTLAVLFSAAVHYAVAAYAAEPDTAA